MMKYLLLVLALIALPVATSVSVRLVSNWNDYLILDGLSPQFVFGFVWFVFFSLLGASLLEFLRK